MALIHLTENLENFKWTDYDKIGNNTGRDPNKGGVHGSTTDKTLQYPKPRLAKMESEFGPLDVSSNRGPYSVVDYFSGRKNEWGPGSLPLGFTKDMKDSLLGPDKEIILTPLSYTIAGMKSSLAYGIVSEQTLNLSPIAAGSWGSSVNPPIATYVSHYGPDSDSPFWPDYAAIHPTDIFHQYEGIEGSKLYDHFDNPFSVPFQHLSLETSPFVDRKGYWVTMTPIDKSGEKATDQSWKEFTDTSIIGWQEGSIHIPSDAGDASVIGGSVNYYGDLKSLAVRSSIYMDANGDYRVPTITAIEGTTVPPGITEQYPSNIETFTDTQITHNIPQIVLSGPFGDEDYYSTLATILWDADSPIALGAHGSITTPLANYVSQYSPDDPFWPNYSAPWPNKIFHELDNVEGTKLYEHFDVPFSVPFNHLSLNTSPFQIQITFPPPPLGDPSYILLDGWKLGSVHIGSTDTPDAPHPNSIFHQLGLISGTQEDTTSGDKNYSVYDNIDTVTFANLPLGTDPFGDGWKGGSIHIPSDITEPAAPWPSIAISYDKQRGIFHNYILGNSFLWANNGSSIDGGSIHISPTGVAIPIQAGQAIHPYDVNYPGLDFGKYGPGKTYGYAALDWVFAGTDNGDSDWAYEWTTYPPDTVLEDHKGPIGGRVSKYSSLSRLVGMASTYIDSSGNYVFPNDWPAEIQQRTFNIPYGYPHDFNVEIDHQFGTSFEDGESYVEMLDVLNEGGKLGMASMFYQFQIDNPDWPYKGVGIINENWRLLPARMEYGTPVTLTWSFGRTPVGEDPWWKGGRGWGMRTDDNPQGGFVFSYTEPLPDTYQPYVTKDVGQRYLATLGPVINQLLLGAERAGDDVLRIGNWLNSPTGKNWSTNQFMLQNLNPRPETRLYNPFSTILSLVPHIHSQRHTTMFGLFGADNYGEYYKNVDEDDFWLWGYGTREPGGFGSVHGSPALGNQEVKSRLTRLTQERISWATTDINRVLDLGFFTGIVEWGATKFGRTPITPTHYVKSQKGPFGKDNIHIGGKSLIDAYSTLAYGAIPQVSPLTEMRENNVLILFDKLKQAETNWIELKSQQKKADDAYSEGDVHFPDSIFPWESKFWTNRARTKNAADLKEEYDSFAKPVLKAKLLYDQSLARYEDRKKIAAAGIGEQGQRGLIKTPHEALGEDIKQGVDGTDIKYSADKINILPYGQDYGDPKSSAVNDLIKFKFKDIVNGKWLIFRAILSGISDSISPEWTGTRYIGRPDQVWVYSGTERSVSFTFDIYPKTKQEFPVLLEKLNYLVGLCYPSFTSDNRMVAPFINLTIGDMFNDTPGFLNSLSIEVDDASTWEYDEPLQFPKHITCACEFTYIGKYLPSSLGKHYELDWLEDRGWTNSGNKAATYGTFRAGEETGEGTFPMAKEPYRIGGMEKLFSTLGAAIEEE